MKSKKSMQPVRLCWQLAPFARFAIAEKLDGVRAIYNPLERTLTTRNGNAITSCQHIVDQLSGCNMMLDGEIYIPGQPLRVIAGLARRNAAAQQLCYYPFDTISQARQDERLMDLASVKRSANIIPHLPPSIRSYKSARLFFNAVICRGGEGVIIRNLDGYYQPGESCDIIKIKPDYSPEDRELERFDIK